jgi:hypothetical protein
MMDSLRKQLPTRFITQHALGVEAQACFALRLPKRPLGQARAIHRASSLRCGAPVHCTLLVPRRVSGLSPLAASA